MPHLESRPLRLLVVLLGIVAGQAVLYGPSLVGTRILLPLDILPTPGYFLAEQARPLPPEPHNAVLADLILATEPGRIFLHNELAAGRFPLWNPYQYAGVPNSLPKFSPFVLLGACFASPRVLPWVELLASCVAGLGMYLFCRRVLLVSRWPATIASWCYPVTGFFVLWLGYGTSYPVVWMPWLLTAIHAALGGYGSLRDFGTSVAKIALLTALVLISGRLDVAAQVLLLSGLFAVGDALILHRAALLRRGIACAAPVVIGWALGFMLAAPDTLPMVQYAATGSRAARRSAGSEERPPIGLAALPQVVLPHLYGSTQQGSFPQRPTGQTNLLESSAAAFSGILITLVLAPLAFCIRRQRAVGFLLAILAFLSLAWCLDVPGVVTVLRLPVLNMMSHNRLTFGAAFSFVALAAAGFEALRQEQGAWRWWLCVPAAILAGLAVWCLNRGTFETEPIVAQLQDALSRGHRISGIGGAADLDEIQRWFTRRHLFAGAIAACGALALLLLWFRRHRTVRPVWLAPLLGALCAADLLWFAHGQPAQSPPALYYPKLPVLETIAGLPPGRMIACSCLAAGIVQAYGLRDIRGYDSVDPARLCELLRPVADPGFQPFPQALLQRFLPQFKLTPPDVVELPPILDLLNVRYVVFPGEPPEQIHPRISGGGLWALENRWALPRAFVPQRVEAVAGDRERLMKLAEPGFDPRAVAYVERPVNVPELCRGSVRIAAETPGRITLASRMETPGLVVLADLWDTGWKAMLDGRPAPIERTNHALLGVVVPAGESTVEFRYAPGSFRLGLWLSALAALVIVFAGGRRRIQRFRKTPVMAKRHGPLSFRGPY